MAKAKVDKGTKNAISAAVRKELKKDGKLPKKKPTAYAKFVGDTMRGKKGMKMKEVAVLWKTSPLNKKCN